MNASQLIGAAEDPPVSRPALWFGLLGGLLAWMLHLMGAYVIAEFGCVNQSGGPVYLGLSLVAWLLAGLSLLALLLAATATLVACRNIRRLRPGPEGRSEVEASLAYMARAGAISGGLSTLVIAVQTVPIFYYLQGC